MNWKRKQKPQR